MSNKKSFRSFLREILLIFIGLLLALFANNWWDDQQQIRETKRALLTLSSEVDSNVENLKNRLLYHGPLQDSLFRITGRTSSSTLSQLPTLDELGFNNGLGIDGQLKAIAWDFMINSQLYGKINFDLRLHLSQAYSDLEQLLLVERIVLEKLMAYLTGIMDEKPKYSDLNLLALLLSDLVRVEEGLKTNLEKAQKLLQE